MLLLGLFLLYLNIYFGTITLLFPTLMSFSFGLILFFIGNSYYFYWSNMDSRHMENQISKRTREYCILQVGPSKYITTCLIDV